MSLVSFTPPTLDGNIIAPHVALILEHVHNNGDIEDIKTVNNVTLSIYTAFTAFYETLGFLIRHEDGSQEGSYFQIASRKEHLLSEGEKNVFRTIQETPLPFYEVLPIYQGETAAGTPEFWSYRKRVREIAAILIEAMVSQKLIVPKTGNDPLSRHDGAKAIKEGLSLSGCSAVAFGATAVPGLIAEHLVFGYWAIPVGFLVYGLAGIGVGLRDSYRKKVIGWVLSDEGTRIYEQFFGYLKVVEHGGGSAYSAGYSGVLSG